MNFRQLLTLATWLLGGLNLGQAVELAGNWTAEIDTQIGVQKYLYEFKAEGAAITGKATFERSIGNGSVALRDIKLVGESISFTEPFIFDGKEIPITYSGKIGAKEMKLTRNVGEFATEQFVAQKVTGPETKSSVPQ